MNIAALMIVFFLQCLGAFEHWRMMKKDGRVNGSFFKDYLFADYPGHSALTIFLIAGTSWVSAIGGAANYLSPDVILSLVEGGKIDLQTATSITSAISTSYGAGYFWDSRFNKGSNDGTIA